MRLFIKQVVQEGILPKSGEIFNRSSAIVSGMLFLSILLPARVPRGTRAVPGTMQYFSQGVRET